MTMFALQPTARRRGQEGRLRAGRRFDGRHVFVFSILVLALSLNIVNKAQNVPRPWYDRQKARADDLEQKLATALDQRDRALQTANKEKRADREHASRERLANFVRYVQNTGVIPVLDRLAQANYRRTQILEKLRDQLAEGKIQVDIDAENGTLRLPSARLFELPARQPDSQGTRDYPLLGASSAEVVPCYLAAASRPPDCPNRRRRCRRTKRDLHRGPHRRRAASDTDRIPRQLGSFRGPGDRGVQDHLRSRSAHRGPQERRRPGADRGQWIRGDPSSEAGIN